MPVDVYRYIDDAARGLNINQRRFGYCAEFYGPRLFYKTSATTFF